MLTGEVSIAVDYEKYNVDKIGNGIKGYVTNTKLTRGKVIENYGQLWNIEKAFRISKTDLRIRPVYHRIRNRVEDHTCVSFAAYRVYKEFERLLNLYKTDLSPEKAISEVREIRQRRYILPKSQMVKTKIFNPTQKQTLLLEVKI